MVSADGGGGGVTMSHFYLSLFAVKGFYAKWADESIKGPASGWNVTPLDVSIARVTITILCGVADHIRYTHTLDFKIPTTQ